MTDELTLQEAALAWAQGKRVEAAPKHHPNNWGEVDGVGKERDRNKYNANIFQYPVTPYIFRLAPEPPAKRFRPWTPEEVPIGALIRFAPVVTSHCWMITGWNLASFFTSNSAMGPVRFEEAEGKGCQHSIDNGKTWLPCGVEVES